MPFRTVIAPQTSHAGASPCNAALDLSNPAATAPYSDDASIVVTEASGSAAASAGLPSVLAGTPPFQDRRSHPLPDLIILDLLMPDVDGFAVLEWVREQNGSIRCPIVVLTSSEQPEHEDRSLDLGAASFHKKPADLDTLGETVREIVETWINSDSSAELQSAG